jgi:hypothetical protein
MEGLIRFDELKLDGNGTRPSTAQTENFPSAQVIEQLRHRLISADFRDPVEIKVAVLAEMVYFCYRELIKRRQV